MPNRTKFSNELVIRALKAIKSGEYAVDVAKKEKITLGAISHWIKKAGLKYTKKPGQMDRDWDLIKQSI